MLIVNKIKSYPSNLEIFCTDDKIINISFDGCQNEFTEQEWREELQQFTKESQDEILQYLERACEFADE
jgi:hypothetical protein